VRPRREGVARRFSESTAKAQGATVDALAGCVSVEKARQVLFRVDDGALPGMTAVVERETPRARAIAKETPPGTSTMKPHQKPVSGQTAERERHGLASLVFAQKSWKTENLNGRKDRV